MAAGCDFTNGFQCLGQLKSLTLNERYSITHWLNIAVTLKFVHICILYFHDQIPLLIIISVHHFLWPLFKGGLLVKISIYCTEQFAGFTAVYSDMRVSFLLVNLYIFA